MSNKDFGEVPASSTLPIFFSSYGKTNGESITMSGLAVTDIEIYKGVSMTQRASDNGYALIDTDGIDIDGITGIHGFSVDLSDNSDSGFYAVGSFYTVVVSTITIDGQTVSFIAATFRIKAAEAIAGKPKVDVDGWLGTACPSPVRRSPAGRPIHCRALGHLPIRQQRFAPSHAFSRCTVIFSRWASFRSHQRNSRRTTGGDDHLIQHQHQSRNACDDGSDLDELAGQHDCLQHRIRRCGCD